MELVRDCLDKQLVDRNGRPIGRVDGIVFEFVDGKQPQVTFVEIGAQTRWNRFHRRLGNLARRISKKVPGTQEGPYRIPWSKIVTAGIEVIAGVEAEETPPLRWELWLRRKVISKIPGG